MGIPALYYVADGNREYARIAVESGWLYGARLPATVYERVDFADQNWREPNLEKYLAAIREHRPGMATVIDWEIPEQLPEVLAWAESVAPFVDRIVVIPKVPGEVDRVPEIVGGKPVVLGYSVPTSYGGTTCGTWEFGRRPVHLLGGSPQAQMDFARYLNVVSTDGSMAALQSRKGRFWHNKRSLLWRASRSSHWCQLKLTGDLRTDGAHKECFRKSLKNIKKTWESLHAR